MGTVSDVSDVSELIYKFEDIFKPEKKSSPCQTQIPKRFKTKKRNVPKCDVSCGTDDIEYTDVGIRDGGNDESTTCHYIENDDSDDNDFVNVAEIGVNNNVVNDYHSNGNHSNGNQVNGNHGNDVYSNANENLNVYDEELTQVHLSLTKIASSSSSPAAAATTTSPAAAAAATTTSAAAKPKAMPHSTSTSSSASSSFKSSSSTSTSSLDQPWYYEEDDRGKTDDILNEYMKQDGTFVVRPSKTGGVSYPYTLSIIYQDHIYHLLVRKRKQNGNYALGNPKADEKNFPTVIELVNFYTSNKVEIHEYNGKHRGSVVLSGYPDVAKYKQ